MKRFEVTGMSCSACSARVEKAVKKLDGVTECTVSLLTNSMTVEGAAPEEEIIKAVADAGYGINMKSQNAEEADFFQDTQTPLLKRRLLSSLGFLAVLMYFSMGHMAGLSLPAFFEGNYLAVALVQLLLSVAVMIINKKFFISGFKGIFKGPNMDTLVALGSSAAFVYSLYMTFLMTDAVTKGEILLAAEYLHELYFESAAMILTLITVGKMLEARSKGKTTDALKGLMKLTPKTAVIISDGIEKEIPASEIKKGDIFIVKAGATIPADGIILEGFASINEASLTGESLPSEKKEGDKVSAATVSTAGFIKCEATMVGDDTLLSQIIKTVSDAVASKAPIAKAADRVSGVFVPVIILIAAITSLIWLILGENAGFSLARGISVLVISCPCALGLATPVAIMVGNSLGAKNGILFKTAASLEETGRARIVALDKTGTITKGEPQVTDIIPLGRTSEEELLSLAASLEKKSEHPIALAIVKKAEEKKLPPDEASDFKTHSGNGVSALVSGKKLVGGSIRFISERMEIPEETLKITEKLSEEGKTPVLFSDGEALMGIICVQDFVKEDSVEAISELREMGIRVVMLTGDNEKTAKAIAGRVGIDEVFSGILPGEKESIIRKLKAEGKAIMVGDGINDAPALTAADIGMAIGCGTDIAIDAADIVLMKSSLKSVPCAIRLSRKTLRNIYENLFWAFIYNIIGIPIAAGAFIRLGLRLNPEISAAAMGLSSFFVVSNALRLNISGIKCTEANKIKKEHKAMEKTMKIEGMMCGHCEARVKQCLEAIDGVAEAIVSHEKNTAIVICEREVSDDILKKTVEDQGYKVL